ncbi:hypothetical protein [Colwellia piezophila]|uniref:hypothetical protein n=1 Tax=Colwellia piezophila TaxID=211668 RepID=UPI00036AE4C8|nr:hypothetical protein [Colwellia piezophila]
MTFLTKIRQFFSKNNSSQCIAIAFQQQSVSLCSIPKQSRAGTAGENPNATVHFQHEKASFTNFLPAINALHSHCKIEGDVCLVLNDAQSQVVQVDKPNLPAGEINGALKWQIKDLVTISPDNMVLDYYDAPTLAGGQERINVVCAPLDELKKIVTATEQGKVKVASITTQEFAFANLLAPQHDANLLVCQQPNEEIVLLIIKQQQIFFHRRLRGFSKIASKTAEELTSSVIDNISLEIQRSTDYFERQLKQAPIKAIKVLIPIELEPHFVEKLAENTAVPVSLLELPSPYHQHRDFAAVLGASLGSVPYSSDAGAVGGENDDS